MAINGMGRFGVRSYLAPSTPTYPTSLKLFIDAGNPLSYSGSGTTVTDLSGTQNGILANGVGYSTANGGYFTFDGINDYITFGSNILQYTNFSTSVWVNVNTTTGFRVPIQNQYYNGSLGYFGWELYILPTTNKCRIDLYNGTVGGGPDTLTSNLALSTSTWYHICFTKISGGDLKMYINGTLDSTKTSTTNNPVYHPSTSLIVGRQVDGAYPVNGSIPTAKIFNTVLSSTEVLADFNEFKTRYGYTNYTTRTSAFATATGITDTTILNALNTFDTGLISNGLDTKMKALYPFVGGTATTHKYNFMDARDLNTAFRLQFNGGWVHSSTGALPNGTNAYADTFLNGNSVLVANNTHVSIYVNNNLTALTGWPGFGTFWDSTSAFYTHLRASNIYYSFIGSENGSASYGNTYANTDTSGYYISSRTSSTNMKAYKDNILKNTTTLTNTATLPPINFTFGGIRASNNVITPSTWNNYSHTFASLGNGLTDTDASNLYTLVQAFQTSLSRQV